LRRVIRALNDAGIEYMVTGSLASSLQGEPRSTHDIDLVVDMERSTVRKLTHAFPPPDFYMDESAMIEAIHKQDEFNLVDTTTGDKVDFWMLKEEPFDRSRFARRQVDEVIGLKIMVSSPEDTILMKLRWANLCGGSEKQFTDALRVYEVQHDKLDMDYLHEWAKNLDVESLLQRIEQEAEEL
jgi:hypothetical protein